MMQLNTFRTSRQRHLLPTTDVWVGGVHYVTPSSAVRDLGIMTDSDVNSVSRITD